MATATAGKPNTSYKHASPCDNTKLMLKELSWYLEDNRFTNLVTELDGSLKRYEAAKRENMAEESLTKLREKSRLLFEDHCVRSGMREEGKSFISIDAEFFSGDALDQSKTALPLLSL